MGLSQSQPRPINIVKIYGADTGRYGTDRDGQERFWRQLIGGAASVRFHRPGSGQGLNEAAQAHIRSARMFLKEFDIIHAAPDAKHALLSDRDPDEAYLTRIGEQKLAVFFTDGGEVKVDLSAIRGDFELKWLDIGKSAWQESSTVAEERGCVKGARLDTAGAAKQKVRFTAWFDSADQVT